MPGWRGVARPQFCLIGFFGCNQGAATPVNRSTASTNSGITGYRIMTRAAPTTLPIAAGPALMPTASEAMLFGKAKSGVPNARVDKDVGDIGEEIHADEDHREQDYDHGHDREVIVPYRSHGRRS